MDALCPNCGAPSEALAAGGEVRLIRDADVGGLQHLFSGWLDEARCPVCNDPLGVDLSVVCVSDDPPAIDVARGSRAEQLELDALLDRVGVAPGPATVHDNLADLAESVTGRFKARHEPLNAAALAIAENRLGEHLREHWRDFTDEVFTAAVVPLVASVPGVTLAVGRVAGAGPPKEEEVARHFGAIQARVWLALCSSWMTDGTHSDSLQGDLDHYVLRGGILPGAVETFDGYVERMQENPELMAHSHYVLGAVRAALCARTGQPNPGVRNWALGLVSLEYLCRRDIERVPPKLRLMRVSSTLARQTLAYADLWWAIGIRLRRLADETKVTRDDVFAFEEVADFAGHPGLIVRLLAALAPDPDPEQLLRSVDAGREPAGDDVDAALDFVQMMDEPLVRGGRAGDLERIADGLLERFDSDDARAAVETWLAKRLKHLRQPQPVLARIGAEPQPWERGLSASRRVALLTERSNALRLAGRTEEALQVAREVLEGLPPDIEPDDRLTAVLNVAILLRETGAPDAAAEMLAELAEQGSVSRRLGALHSLATTLAQARRIAEAIAALERAVALAEGPYADRAPTLQAGIAMLESGRGNPERAVQALPDGADALSDPMVAMPAGSALVNILHQDAGLVDGEQVEAVAVALESVRDTAVAQRDALSACGAARILATLHDVLGIEDAETRWQQARAIARELGVPPFPEELLRLAAFAYGRDDAPAARALLAELPQALAPEYGAVRDLAAVAGATSGLRYAAERLAGAALAAADAGADVDWGDVRLIADIGRDAVTRAAAAQPAGGELLLRAGDEDLQALAVPGRNLAVVEWVETEDHYRSLLTAIRPDGVVTSRWLDAPGLSLQEVAGELPATIRGWRRRRSGDPLDDPRWRRLVVWWHEQLASELDDGDHVVVLEHPDFLGLPWHAACGERWSCSYAGSWFALLRPRTTAAADAIGVVRVPKHGDAEELQRVLLTSAERTQAFAAANDLAFEAVDGPQADADAVMDLLTRVDVAKLLCHGYIDAQAGEVALMVAHGGALPLRHSIASGTAAGRRYRLGWAALQDLERAPGVVFSLACSSGVAHVAGLGERLGLFAAFGRAGGRSLVAPRWEVPARDVAPVLDAAMEAWMTDGGELAGALQRACAAAAETLPPRYAWALAVEGDWR